MTKPNLRDNMSERDLQDQILSVAGVFGWLAYHTHHSRRSQRGFPDLTLVRGDILAFVELKSAKGAPTIDQVLWLDALSATGVWVMLWRPRNLDAATSWLGGDPGSITMNAAIAAELGVWVGDDRVDGV